MSRSLFFLSYRLPRLKTFAVSTVTLFPFRDSMKTTYVGMNYFSGFFLFLQCFAELLTKFKSEQEENEFLRQRIHKLEQESRKKDELIAQLRSEKKGNCDRCGVLTH